MVGLFILLAIVSAPTPVEAFTWECERRVCLFESDLLYDILIPSAAMNPENIPPEMCTHIIFGYAFLKNGSIVPDYIENESNGSYKGNYEKIMDLKKKNPHLKVLLCLGGTGQNISEIYTDIRDKRPLVNRTIKYLRDRNFDGLDIFWYFTDNSPPYLAFHVAAYIKSLRQGFNQEGNDTSRLLLTSTEAGGYLAKNLAYREEGIIAAVDWFNVLSININQPCINRTSHHSPLFTGKNKPGFAAENSLETLGQVWVNRGVPKDKIVLGITFFGKGFQLTSSNNSLGASKTQGPSGKYFRGQGTYSYFEICEMMSKGGMDYDIYQQCVPYFVYDNLWIGYDNEASVLNKARFVRKNRFGGVLADSLSYDDFNGTFCRAKTFPLLRIMAHECEFRNVIYNSTPIVCPG